MKNKNYKETHILMYSPAIHLKTLKEAMKHGHRKASLWPKTCAMGVLTSAPQHPVMYIANLSRGH
jgi:hypothetical protein